MKSECPFARNSHCWYTNRLKYSSLCERDQTANIEDSDWDERGVQHRQQIFRNPLRLSPDGVLKEEYTYIYEEECPFARTFHLLVHKHTGNIPSFCERDHSKH
ncbi:hypothetical protein AVEN_5849-1 [Araneus ventricosus]|uniref:Uncharacterized protein n=1 Tax=Araneus ventricosus TaxID=182803 RepID=A0A4Y2S4N5_ARAVE|nr:hypothetical protein AVEN_5849-1 [Araneus ventricosus]